MDDHRYDDPISIRASADFERARRKAFIHDLVANLSGRPNWLMAFEEVERALPIRGQVYKGMQEVPVANIVGSVDRYHDFDRAFLPTQARTRPRWESVDRAALTDVPLPPVQLYKVGDVYFVKDGNHRVSVAREKGAQDIDAEVIELSTNANLTRETNPRDLLSLGEYTRFLEATQLDELHPGVDIKFSSLGRYDDLLEHISAHRWYMGIEQDRPIEWQEAVLDWYDNIYKSLADIIESTQVLRDFPGRTVGDLYLWIMDHKWYLREDTGEEIGIETATHQYVEAYGSWTRRVLRYLRRLREAATRPLVVTAQGIGRALKGSDDEEEEAEEGKEEEEVEEGTLAETGEPDEA